MWRKLLILLAALWLTSAWVLLGQYLNGHLEDDSNNPGRNPGRVRVYQYTSDVVVDFVTENGDTVFVLPLSRALRDLLLTTIRLLASLITLLAIVIVIPPFKKFWQNCFYPEGALPEVTLPPYGSPIQHPTTFHQSTAPIVLDYANAYQSKPGPSPLARKVLILVWLAALLVFVFKLFTGGGPLFD